MDQSKSSNTQLLLFSVGLGIFLFFQDQNLALYFDGNTAYSDFAENIFKINTSYFAESILLPLAAKLMGASSSLHAYKIFCALIIIMMLPVLSIAAYRYFDSRSIALAFVLLLAVIFPWFRMAGLGQPDPLTIGLLILAALQKKPHKIFWCLLGAALSHFSLLLMTLPAVIAFLLSTGFNTYSKKMQCVRLAILALLIGKLGLSLWYFIFSYELGTRLDWIVERWPDFFIERYQSDPVAFWLTPNLYFLIIYSAMMFYFLLLKRYAFIFSMLVSLSCAYVANFITIDGYRIVAVILAAPITYVLIEILSINKNQVENFFRSLYQAAVKFVNFIVSKWAEIVTALSIVCCWAYVVKSASARGLLLNQFAFSFTTLGDIEPLTLIVAVGICSHMALMIFDRLRASALIMISQLVLLMPLGLMTLQYFRQVYFFNQPLDLVGKVAAAVYLLFLVVCCMRVKIILPASYKVAVQLRRLFR